MSGDSLLERCSDTNQSVLQILKKIEKEEDVTEFITTVQLVQITINFLLKSEKKYGGEQLKAILTSLEEFQTELQALLSGNKLVRFVASIRLRRKLEGIMAQVHENLEAFKRSFRERTKVAPPPVLASSIEPPKSGIAERSGSWRGANPVVIGESRTSNPSAPYLSLRGASTSSSSLPVDNRSSSSDHLSLEPNDMEESILLSVLIDDKAGRNFWFSAFGSETFMVHHDVFLKRWKDKISPEMTKDEEVLLLYVLDNSYTGNINQHRFNELIKGFGPINEVLNNMKSIMSSPWFYGFLNKQEADMLLRTEPSGTYLIRFSSTQPGSFALGYTIEGKVSHILIKAFKPLGFVVPSKDKPEGRIFSTLFELVDCYKAFLSRSYWNPLSFESFFEGDMSSAEADEALSGYLPGTFLVRFSLNHPPNLCISHKDAKGVVCHTLIQAVTDPSSGRLLGYSVPMGSTPTVYPQVNNVIEYYGSTLKVPLKKLTNPNWVDANARAQKWKEERRKLPPQRIT
eukprot:TRINITY_DN4438_c0_g1_i1.p1 TRINITY_DN4438_c0_g1~~TRINITY_DN4438_c0_g1_i1.p1  ORF type:complete len:514 (-),score=113.99 TRINITY_DN4438_c0_g1_i1:18-1559(-)